MYRYQEKSFEYLIKISKQGVKKTEDRKWQERNGDRMEEKDTNVKMAGCKNPFGIGKRESWRTGQT